HPVDIGQAEVQYYQVRLPRRGFDKACLAGLGLEDAHRLRREAGAQKPADLRIVLDDHQRRRRSRGHDAAWIGATGSGSASTAGGYLAAFSRRLAKTCSSRTGSTLTSGRSRGRLTRTGCATSTSFNRASTLPTISSSGVHCRASSTAPDSSRAMSSRLPTSVDMRLDSSWIVIARSR